ncbi:kinase-like domain-containing protein [Xylaria digitata]|nr:kinase-like domain-containing protein [Xylaria digitata]
MAQQQARILGQQIQGYFETSSYWEYEKSLGHGGYGLATLLVQKAEVGQDRQRIALKVALPSSAEELRSEIMWLKKLHGAKHIVKILASCDNAAQPDWDESPLVEGQRPLPPHTPFTSLAQIEGPVLALEYIENGDMLNLFRRMSVEDVHMPNRMLWSLYLCLIRACIGMAYPISNLVGTPSVLETIPTDGTLPQGIKHNDIAIRNVMIGTGDGLDEHHIGHIFKLIDFGEAGAVDDPNLGPPENLFTISAYVAFFINMAGINQRQPVMYKGFATRGGQLLPQSWGEPYPWLDPDLAGLIAECMYDDLTKRPTLQQALDRARHAVLNKTADSFPEPEEETDKAIMDFVQQFVLDCSA